MQLEAGAPGRLSFLSNDFLLKVLNNVYACVFIFQFYIFFVEVLAAEKF